MSLQNSLTEMFSNFRLNYNCCLITIGINYSCSNEEFRTKLYHFLCSFQWFAQDAPFIWEMHFAYHWRNWKNCIIFANFLLTNRGCSIEIKGVFARDNELDLHNVHESPKIEHLPFSDMRKGEGQMKVKNLRKRKQNVQMNLLNLEQRDWQPNLSIKDKKLQMN